MRRSLLLLFTLLFIAGCSQSAPPTPSPAPTPALPAPSTDGVVPPAPTATPPLISPPGQPATVTAIYRDLAAGYGKRPEVPVVPKACAPGSSSAPVSGEIKALNWEPYPGTAPLLWVPTVTLQLCNPGAELAGASLVVTAQGALFESTEELGLSSLASGSGTGMVKVFLPTGMPDGLLRLIEERRLAWPEVRVQLSLRSGEKEQPLGEQTLMVPAGRTGASIAEWSLPDLPSAELLQAANWTGRGMTRGSDGTELFLYAPDMRFRIQDLIGCNPPGGVGVESKDWGLWSLRAGGAPRLVGSVGGWLFQGSYTWTIEERPQVQSTFILLNHPSSCHYPGGAAIWYYDPVWGAVAKPTVTVGVQEVPANAPSLTIHPDGSLQTYDLANVGEESAWIRQTYYWHRERLNWSLTPAPTRPTDPPETPPGRTPTNPPTGPGGPPTDPGSVYP